MDVRAPTTVSGTKSSTWSPSSWPTRYGPSAEGRIRTVREPARVDERDPVTCRRTGLSHPPRVVGHRQPGASAGSGEGIDGRRGACCAAGGLAPRRRPGRGAGTAVPGRRADPCLVHSAELESITGLTRFDLSRQFRAVLGTSPHRYLLMRRLEFARDQIHRERPLVEVASRRRLRRSGALHSHVQIEIRPDAHPLSGAASRSAVAERAPSAAGAPAAPRLMLDRSAVSPLGG